MSLARDCIVPVLDVMGGIAVHAVAGDRANYKPLQTRLADSADPVAIARGYRDRLGCRALYLADLDAIRGERPPALDLYRALAEQGRNLWVDAGIRSAEDVAPLRRAGAATVIVGLESCPVSAWGDVLGAAGPEHALFSLDLRDGIPITAPGDRGRDALSIARGAIAAGFRRLLVLDLARVGVGSGPGTLPLATSLVEIDPALEIIAGGGVRDIGDVRALLDAGVSSVLVGSALHDGRIGRREMDSLA